METPENRINTVTIPIEEYFDLRQRADLTAGLLMRLNELERRVDNDLRYFHDRLNELENRR